jgi:hypothetical protein
MLTIHSLFGQLIYLHLINLIVGQSLFMLVEQVGGAGDADDAMPLP